MKITHIAIAVSMALASAVSVAKTESLGTLGAAGNSFGNSFWTWGSFTDYYTFTVGSGDRADGATVSYDSVWQDIRLTSVALQSWTGSSWSSWGGSSGTDLTPSAFSFNGLGGGQYRLAVAGKIGAQFDLNDPFKPASYQGTLRAIAAPVPEPGALGMALVGLVGLSLVAARRQRG